MYMMANKESIISIKSEDYREDDIHACEAISIIKHLDSEKDRQKTIIKVCTEIGFMKQQVSRLEQKLRLKESVIQELEEKLSKQSKEMPSTQPILIEYKESANQTLTDVSDFTAQVDLTKVETQNVLLQTEFDRPVDTFESFSQTDTTSLKDSQTQMELNYVDTSVQVDIEMIDKATQNRVDNVDNTTQFEIELVDRSTATDKREMLLEKDFEMQTEANTVDNYAQSDIQFKDESTQIGVDVVDNMTQFEIELSDAFTETDIVDTKDTDTRTHPNTVEASSQIIVDMVDKTTQNGVDIVDNMTQFEIELSDAFTETDIVNTKDTDTRTHPNTVEASSQIIVDMVDKTTQNGVDIVESMTQFEIELVDRSTATNKREMLLEKDFQTQTETNTVDNYAQSDIKMVDKTTQNDVEIVDKREKKKKGKTCSTQTQLQTTDVNIQTNVDMVDKGTCKSIKFVDKRIQTAACWLNTENCKTQRAKNISTQLMDAITQTEILERLQSSDAEQHYLLPVIQNRQDRKTIKVELKLPSINGKDKPRAREDERVRLAQKKETFETQELIQIVGKYHQKCIPPPKKEKSWKF